MKRKIMAWLLSGIMMLHPVAGVQAAEFSDGVAGYFNEEENDTEENQADDFSTNEEDGQFSDEQNGNASSSEVSESIPEAEELDDGDEKTQKLEAATSDNTSGKCGEDAYWSFKNGTLVITGKGNVYRWGENSKRPWEDLKFNIKNVIIEQGITSIGGYMLYGCSNIEKITVPNSVTSIGIQAFRGCSSLKTMVIPNGVTSIKSAVFYECSSLKTIMIPDSVMCIDGSAFSGCSSLETITIPDGVTKIDWYAFSGCRNLPLYGWWRVFLARVR